MRNADVEITLTVKRDGPLVPRPEHHRAVRLEAGRELHGERGGGVEGAQAVVCSAGVPPRVSSARLTHT